MTTELTMMERRIMSIRHIYEIDEYFWKNDEFKEIQSLKVLVFIE